MLSPRQSLGGTPVLSPGFLRQSTLGTRRCITRRVDSMHAYRVESSVFCRSWRMTFPCWYDHCSSCCSFSMPIALSTSMNA